METGSPHREPGDGRTMAPIGLRALLEGNFQSSPDSGPEEDLPGAPRSDLSDGRGDPTWLRPEKLLEMIVWQGGPIKPRISLRVDYEVERRGNKPFEALGQRTDSRKSGTRTVRRRCICQHKAEMGLGSIIIWSEYTNTRKRR